MLCSSQSANPMTEYWPATWVLRRNYPERGLPWRAGGSKEHERALTEVVKVGWLVRRRANRKTTGVRLTPSGLVEAWRLVGIDPDDAFVVTEEVDRLGPDRRLGSRDQSSTTDAVGAMGTKPS